MWRGFLLKELAVAKLSGAVVVGLVVAAGAAWFFDAAGSAPAAQPAPDGQPVVVLDTKSVWHTYTALKPPVVQSDGALKPITSLYPWVDKETPLAPEGWKARDFADESWLRGNGCVPIYDLMEDAATAEISRSQLWQWIRYQAMMNDGRNITPEMFDATLREVAGRLKAAETTPQDHKFDRAAELFTTMSKGEYEEFLTSVAYRDLV